MVRRSSNALTRFKRRRTRGRRLKARRYPRPRRLLRYPFKLGKSIVRRLRYFDPDVELDAGAASWAEHSFSTNGLYDPDVSGTGHQPLGFDQFMQFYKKYLVMKCKITVQFVNTDALANQIIGIYTINKDSGNPADLVTIIENGMVKYRILGMELQTPAIRTLTKTCYPNKALNTNKPTSDDQVIGTSSANPVKQMYFRIMAAPQDQSAENPAVVRCSVRMEFTALFFDPIMLTTS